MKKSHFFLFLIFQLFACEYEQLHELVAIDFETEVNCYWTTFTPTADVSGDYFWDFGDGDTSSQKNPRHIYDLAGQYEVKLKIVSEEGVGEMTKNLIINQPSDNTFRTNNENGFYGDFMSVNPETGGYFVLHYDFESDLTSVHNYSSAGLFEGIKSEGRSIYDFVAFFSGQGKGLSIANNIEQGTVIWGVSEGTRGIVNGRVKEEGTYFTAHKALIDKDKLLLVALGNYGKSEEDVEGFFLEYFHWSVGNQFLKISLESDLWLNQRPVMALTPKGGVIVAYAVENQGVKIFKLEETGERVWETLLPETNFFSTTSYDEIKIAAESEEDYLISITQTDGYFGTCASCTPQPKTHFIRVRSQEVLWRKTLAGIVRVGAITFTSNGDIVAGGEMTTGQTITRTSHFIRLTADGTVILNQPLFVEENNIDIQEIFERPNGEFLIVGSGLTFLQVDCGGRFKG